MNNLNQHNLGFGIEYNLLKNGKIKEKWDDSPLPKMEGTIKIEDVSPEGIIVASHKHPLDSFVLNLIDQSIGSDGTRLARWNKGTANSNAIGIVCGSSSTAVALNQSSLVSKIANSAGGLYYETPTNCSAPVLNGSYAEITMSRQVKNYSASPITINEYGIEYSNNMIFCRDVITTGASLAVNYSRNITYTLKFPVSTSKAWLKNFMTNIQSTYNRVSMQYTDRTGTLVRPNNNTTFFDWWLFCNYSVRAAAGSSNYGIIVGTGNANVDWENDYNLTTPIVHGNGAGQLYHSACADDPSRYKAPYTSGTSRIVEWWRDFTNNSGNSITVNEAGVACYSVSELAYNVMIARWLTGGITVPNGEALRIKFKPKVTV